MMSETSKEGVPYKGAREILDAYRRWEQTRSVSPELINRRIVAYDNDEAYIEVRFDTSVTDEAQRSAEVRLGKTFVWNEKEYAIRFTRGSMAKPLAFPGPAAAAAHCAGVHDGDEAEPDFGVIGTVGWCFVVNGAPVGLSNWHVLCANGSCVGSDVVLNSSHAATVMHVKAPTAGPNHFDFALAQLSNPASICGIVKGNQFEVPLLLTPDLHVNTADEFRWVGLHNTATHALLVGLADVDYRIGQHVFHFIAQLAFKQGDAQSGDSGSLAVRKSDNSAAGLLFARDDDTVYANPICTLLDWQRTGTQKTPGGEFPIFTGSLP